MNYLSKAETTWFQKYEHQEGIKVMLSSALLFDVSNAGLASGHTGVWNCQAYIAGGFPRDCLLRDGNFEDLDVFILAPPNTSFSLLSYVFSNMPKAAMYLLISGNKTRLTISDSDLTAKGFFALKPCTGEAGGSDDFPLSFRGTGEYRHLNISLRDEHTVEELVGGFPVSLSKAFIPLFPMGELTTTPSFDYSVQYKTINIAMDASNKIGIDKYLTKLLPRFPGYATAYKTINLHRKIT